MEHNVDIKYKISDLASRYGIPKTKVKEIVESQFNALLSHINSANFTSDKIPDFRIPLLGKFSVHPQTHKRYRDRVVSERAEHEQEIRKDILHIMEQSLTKLRVGLDSLIQGIKASGKEYDPDCLKNLVEGRMLLGYTIKIAVQKDPYLPSYNKRQVGSTEIAPAVDLSPVAVKIKDDPIQALDQIRDYLKAAIKKIEEIHDLIAARDLGYNPFVYQILGEAYTKIVMSSMYFGLELGKIRDAQ